MEISVIFPNEPSKKETLQIIKKVGQSKFSVHQVYCPSKNTTYALKSFPNNSFGITQYKNEAILACLSHPNIIQNVPVNISAAQNSQASFMLTEFAQYGDFFELVVGGILNEEILIRTYFHQFIAGLEYLHSQGAAHLDLKLENLMMGTGFNLKIIDFDQAQKTTDKRLKSFGTTNFRALEMINGSCTDFAAADVYSAGAILYAMRAQECPFGEVEVGKVTSLKHYSVFITKNKQYWDAKATLKKDKAFFSESFKELVNGMLEYDVKKRFTINDIKKSRWFNGPVLDSQSLKTEMETRWNNFANAKKLLGEGMM